MTASSITRLSDVRDVACYGEKAVRLAEMHRAGLSVPTGWVISGAAFQSELQNSGATDVIHTQLENLNSLDHVRLADIAAQIAVVVKNVSLSNGFLQQLKETSRGLLESGPVAVRSSACGEDSAESAFAGQLDTVLNVNSTDALLSALRTCWASCWSHRSLVYQQRRGVRLTSMGVILQTQVNAQISGVMFTRSPQDSSGDDMVIEHCEGLGEALVSGQVTPSRTVVNRHTLHITEDSDALAASTVRQLVAAGIQTEERFDAPQDVEWSMDADGGLQILQSRPITAFAQVRPMVVWSNANVNENFPEPISPLLYSIASTGYYHYFRNMGIAFGISSRRIDAMDYPLRNIIGTHAGRMYYNLTSIHAVLRAAPSGEFLAEAFNQFVGAEATKGDRRRPNWKSAGVSRWRELSELLRIGRKAIGRFRKLHAGVAKFEVTVEEYAGDCTAARLVTLVDSEDCSGLLSLWRRFLRIRSEWTHAALADAASMISYRLTHQLLEGEFTDESDQAVANRLLTGLCDIVSGLPTEKLWDLSRAVRQHKTLADAFATESAEQVLERIQTDESLQDVREQWNQFLDQWGFRCSGELMLTKACYQEDPVSLIPVLATFVTRNGRSPHEHLREQQQNRELETSRVLEALKRRRLIRWLPWPGKHRIANRLIKWTQQSIACRERARLKQALLYSRFRQLALAVGRVLVRRRRLEREEDLFCLTFDEVEALLSGTAMLPDTIRRQVAVRLAELKTFQDLQPPDQLELEAGRYWVPDLANAEDSPDESGGVLRGTGVCGGVMTGRAVVLSDPREFDQVAENDILVTRQTDPGWGPILFLVRGLVMERGGMLSHGAILAREYGIPTVVGIPRVTQKIVTGSMIRIDGDRGVVEILGE